MERVILESPYAGNIKVNEIFGEFAMKDCLVNYNEAPFASHLLYTRKYCLKDTVGRDRTLGIAAGFCWRDVAQKTVFYDDLGMTLGMIEGKEDCEKKGNPYEIRNLPVDLWEKFLNSMEKEGIEVIRAKKKG